MSDPLLQAEKWMQMGKEVVVATVIDTWEGAPNRIGSQLVVDESGAHLGAVSGGCIEPEILLEAKNIIMTGEPKLLKFDVSNKIALENALDFGGHIQVYLERVG